MEPLTTVPPSTSSPPERWSENDSVFEAIASPVRRSILDVLRDGEEHTAADVAERVDDLSRSAASRHLRVLRDAELVRAERVGRSWQYAIETEPLESIYHSWLVSYVSLPRSPADAPTNDLHVVSNSAVGVDAPAAVIEEPVQDRDHDQDHDRDRDHDHDHHYDHDYDHDYDYDYDQDQDDVAAPAATAAPEQEAEGPRSAEELVARISERLVSIERNGRESESESRTPSPLMIAETWSAARSFGRSRRTKR